MTPEVQAAVTRAILHGLVVGLAAIVAALLPAVPDPNVHLLLVVASSILAILASRVGEGMYDSRRAAASRSGSGLR